MSSIEEKDYKSSDDEDYLPQIDGNDETEDNDDLEYDDVEDDLVSQTKQNATNSNKKMLIFFLFLENLFLLLEKKFKKMRKQKKLELMPYGRIF